MRIDAHQHFWCYSPSAYSWISDDMHGLKRDYLPNDLQPLLDRTGIVGTIAVQARHDMQESDWLLDLAEQHTFIKGVVGWVDLRAPDVRDHLERYAHRPKLRGIRHLIHDEPDDNFMLQPAFLRGLDVLADFNLTYDLLLFPRHLPVAVEVVRRLPQQRFVLDHIAKPPIRAQAVAPWASDIAALAQFPNVYCKISGMVTEAAWQRWTLADFTRYLDVVFACFGPDRVMFGSDWPVCTLSATYAEVVLILQEYVRGLPVDTQERIFGDNAVHCYGLTT